MEKLSEIDTFNVRKPTASTRCSDEGFKDAFANRVIARLLSFQGGSLEMTFAAYHIQSDICLYLQKNMLKWYASYCNKYIFLYLSEYCIFIVCIKFTKLNILRSCQTIFLLNISFFLYLFLIDKLHRNPIHRLGVISLFSIVSTPKVVFCDYWRF